MSAILPPKRAPYRVPAVPQPAVRIAHEDRGQRYLKIMRDSAMSDTYPAGQTRVVQSETPRSGDSEARHNMGRGEAVGSVPDHPSSRSDSARAAVPAREMEPHGGVTRRGHNTATRRDVSIDVRLTTKEREAIRARARSLNVKPSVWARAVILDSLDKRSTLEEALQTTAREAPNVELADAVEQLRRVGVNLNQALRKGQAIDTSLLHAVLTSVSAVRSRLGDRTAS